MLLFIIKDPGTVAEPTCLVLQGQLPKYTGPDPLSDSEIIFVIIARKNTQAPELVYLLVYYSPIGYRYELAEPR